MTKNEKHLNLKGLTETAGAYLAALCTEIPERCVGSDGNRKATAFFAQRMRAYGYRVETPGFECFDWKDGGSRLEAGGKAFDVKTSPYTRGIHLNAPLCTATSVEELKALAEAGGCGGNILLVRGDIAKEQLMPRNFPFYNPDHHKEIVHLLENSGAGAIVCATTRDTQTAGAVYPFPLVEDGDFEIPSAFMTEEEGARLAEYDGQAVSLTINAQRHPATGCNVTARKVPAGDENPGDADRIVVCAHIDSKQGTPGAIDNATGVVVLLLLAELLQYAETDSSIEITALNGEDYFSAPGQLLFLDCNKDTLSGIKQVINLDGAGYFKGNTAFSMYGCGESFEKNVRDIISRYPGIEEGPPWYQGDHSMFIQKNIPALAVTSGGFTEKLLAEIVHTPKDEPAIVDCSKLAEIAFALHDVLVKEK